MSTLTKKHFNRFAEWVRAELPHHEPVRCTLANSLGKVLAEFNPNFDHARWLEACDTIKEDQPNAPLR